LSVLIFDVSSSPICQYELPLKSLQHPNMTTAVHRYIRYKNASRKSTITLSKYMHIVHYINFITTFILIVHLKASVYKFC